MGNAKDKNGTGERERLGRLRRRLEDRSTVLAALRGFFSAEGMIEVETPTRVRAPAPERHIEAEPSGDRYLITSPELQMKRLLADGGLPAIFQICHCFRRGERGERHLPEFTMIEWYRVGGDLEQLMGDCEGLVEATATALGPYPRIAGPNGPVDLAPPYERLTVDEAFERHAGWRPGADPDPDRFDRDLVDLVEPALPPDRPVFLWGYPASMAALARLDPNDPTGALRCELYAGGLELANGFVELTDAAEQRARFEAEATGRAADGRARYPIDERFLGALERGLPDCAGIALGFDRLMMLLTGARSIDDVVAFTPELL